MATDSPPVLRPLNLADILDQSISLYRRNFAVFAGITALVYIPVGILQMAVGFFLGGFQQGMPRGAGQVPWGQLSGMGIAGLGLVLVSLLVVPLGQGALAIAVSRRYLNEPVTVSDAYGAIGNQWGPLIATVVVLGLATFAGLMLCLIPGIYLGVLWMFATPIIVLEMAPGPVAAAKRSSDLVGNEWWRCFGVYLLLYLLISAVTYALALPVSIVTAVTLMQHNMALYQAINQGISTAVSVLVQPVLMVGLVMLYYDLRIRKEGFDLELLARALGKTLPVAQPAEVGLWGSPKAEGTLWASAPTAPPPPPPPAGQSASPAPIPAVGATVSIPPVGGASSPDEATSAPTPSPEAADAALLPPDDDAVTPFNVNGQPPA